MTFICFLFININMNVSEKTTPAKGKKSLKI